MCYWTFNIFIMCQSVYVDDCGIQTVLAFKCPLPYIYVSGFWESHIASYDIIDFRNFKTPHALKSEVCWVH